MAHTVLAVVLELLPQSADLCVRRIKDDLTSKESPDYRQSSTIDTLHFMSISVFDDPHYDPLLVFENNFDGGRVDHWRKLVAVFGPQFRGIFSCCKASQDPRYAAAFTSGSDEALIRFLDDHVVEPAAYHIGNQGMTAARVLRERDLMNAVQAYLDGNQEALQSRPPAEIHRTIRATFAPDAKFQWLNREGPRVTKGERLRNIVAAWPLLVPILGLLLGIPALIWSLWHFGLNRFTTGGLIVLGIVVVIVALLAVRLRRLEKSDFVETMPDPNEITMAAIARKENKIAQNHIASMVLIKPGVTRTILIRVGLLALKHYARLFCTDGYLGPMRTIHFAHWSVIGNGGRLMFLSNYDGSWESYLDDFIDKAHDGLTLAWSNCVGFPPTRWLHQEGATHGLLFKAWARQSQRESLFWYSAYPRLTVNQIERNFAVAEGLRRTQLTDKEAASWLRLF